MPRMRDMIKSISDVHRDSEKEDQKKKPDEATGLSGLDAIRNAIKANLQNKPSSSVFTQETQKPRISSPPTKPISVSPDKVKPIKAPLAYTKAEDFEDKSFSDKLYMDYHRLLGTIVNDIKSKKLIDPKPLEKNIFDLIEANNASEFLFMKAIQRKRFATWVVSHSVNVTIFALKIGFGLKYKKNEMHQLAIASLLHDVGMVKVPNKILFKHGKLSSDEYDVIRQHPIHGYEIVKHLKDDYPYLLNAVYQEQEREDGSGYPQGLKGDKICEFAKIIGTADIFEALVHGRTYREGFITYYAIQNILETKSHQFSPKMIRSLISVISMFPLGSLVELNTGEIARVVVTNRSRPVRPIVEISEDLEGHKLDPPTRLDLEKEPLIFITKPITE
ncbi:MAG: hypothetical protein DRP89_08695 [Candidatus Neomarinimicrobiota bacterium]|nr:MAG: hypothetical protein DRP89_08695 [Candidatus Neomarinimicrobiota bacterium]